MIYDYMTKGKKNTFFPSSRMERKRDVNIYIYIYITSKFMQTLILSLQSIFQKEDTESKAI